MFLREYSRAVNVLRGVGPVLKQRLAQIGIHSICDLLNHFPRDYQDRRSIDPLASALKKERINSLVRVVSRSWIGRGYKKVLRVLIADDSGKASLVCFGRNFLEKYLIPGKYFWVSGSFKYRYGEAQSSNFDIEIYKEEKSKRFQRILPIYPLSEGLIQGLLRRLMDKALVYVEPDLSEEIPEPLKKRYRFLSKLQALKFIHFPESWDQLKKARHTLIFEELFYYQLILEKLRLKRQSIYRHRRKPQLTLKSNLIERLPFRLTDDQKHVLSEIENDLFSHHPMARLIQGDVGSGKTLIAFLASLAVIESGEQVAFLAPTELLARQHANNAAVLFEPLGISLAFLSGNIKGVQRERLKAALNGGDIDLVIGTHALFSTDIAFKKLGLVIVDEQHRFGVRQRQALVDKGDHPDLLLLTATPIPRTLALTLFGDLELSEIRNKPEGRKPVITHLTRQGNEKKVYDRVREEVKKGRQAYFVYPLIEESTKLQLKDAESMYLSLKRSFSDLNLKLIHSRIPEEDKQMIMDAFVSGKVDILVATSVMEVGLDVANANCIVIEHAERFGLSNLHQLRGRVGRGSYQSYAFLIYSNSLTESGIQRLKVIMTTHDGFIIAQEDLNIRGPGEFLGVKQSGFLRLGHADPLRDQEILIDARKEANGLLRDDPDLCKPENRICSLVLKTGSLQRDIT